MTGASIDNIKLEYTVKIGVRIRSNEDLVETSELIQMYAVYLDVVEIAGRYTTSRSLMNETTVVHFYHTYNNVAEIF